MNPVVLVGASGFLEGTVALELLEHRPEVNLRFLVRARDAREAMLRLVHLLLKSDLSFNCYHLSSGDSGSCTFDDIDRVIGAHESSLLRVPELRLFDMNDLPALQAHFRSWFGPCDARAAAAAIKVYSAFAALNVSFDNTRLLTEGVAPPPKFTDYVGACAYASIGTTIAEQMMCDMR